MKFFQRSKPSWVRTAIPAPRTDYHSAAVLSWKWQKTRREPRVKGWVPPSTAQRYCGQRSEPTTTPLLEHYSAQSPTKRCVSVMCCRSYQTKASDTWVCSLQTQRCIWGVSFISREPVWKGGNRKVEWGVHCFPKNAPTNTHSTLFNEFISNDCIAYLPYHVCVCLWSQNQRHDTP